MSEIVLSPEQSRLIADATGPVLVRDASGGVLGILEPASPPDRAEVDEIQARLGRPHQRFTIAQVLAMLHSDAN